MFGCLGLWLILGLVVISVAVAKKLWLLISFAGLLSVVSCVLIDKWLIINAIHFSGMHALSGCYGVMHCRHWGVAAIFIVMIWDAMY